MLLVTPLIFAACGDWSLSSTHRALPFPTPGQRDLVVLTSPGELSYKVEDKGQVSGIEHDLIEAFAEELGVGVKYVVVAPEEIEAKLSNRTVHLAAAWLGPPDDPKIRTTPHIRHTRDILIQHEASLPLLDSAELKGKTVHVIAGSRQATTFRALQKSIPDLVLVEERDPDPYKLLETLAAQRIKYVAMDSAQLDIANQFFPTLQATLRLEQEQPIVWLLGEMPNAELEARANAFVQRVQRDGTLARLDDRYFGHVQRLDQADIVKFLGEIKSTLPKFRNYFQAAEVISGIDWRLLAAVAYHESNWDPNATSYTNVRGIMMLTEETADRLEVSNRLDPSDSILAGARYINLLKEMLPPDVAEPDRTWLALAAYNIGPGNFNNARKLARKLKADPASWYEMKLVLPKLAQAKYTSLIGSGRARGGEAVILVENIRSYYDILQRNTPALSPALAKAESLKRLVDEVTQRRKDYVRKTTVAKSLTPNEPDENDELAIAASGTTSKPPRLPNYEPESNLTRPTAKD